MAAHKDELNVLVVVGASHNHANKTLPRLAELGGQGHHEGNIKRDMLLFLGFQLPLLVQLLK